MAKKNRQQLISSSIKAFAASQYVSAVDLLTELINREPNNLEWLDKRAVCYLHLEMFNKALPDIAKVVQAEPKNQPALSNFGVALLKTNKYQHARQILEYLLELNPNSYEACINLATVYQMLKMPNEQMQISLRAIEIDPKSATAFNNLASSFGDRGMHKESLEALLIAEMLNPKEFPTKVNLAQTHFNLGNFIKATEIYEEIINSKDAPYSIRQYAKYSSAFAYLTMGHLEKGWDGYEFGFGLSIGGNLVNRALSAFPEPKWRGENLNDKTLFVIREQGLGDEIMFSTCYADLERLKNNSNTNIVIKCEPRLTSINQRTYPSLEFIADTGLVGEMPTTYNNKPIDYYVAIGSLPGLFRRKIENFELPIKNFVPNEKLFNDYKSRLANYANYKLVGICWRSGFLDVTRNEGYSVLTDWGELLKQPNMIFVNLQYGECEKELLAAEEKFGIKILRWVDTDLKNDLESLIALMKNLDAIVSVNSAPFALGGATGVKTFLLTGENLWTMLGLKNEFPWYKSVVPITYKINEEHVLKGLTRIIYEI